MTKLIKLLALLLAVIICVTAFTSCSELMSAISNNEYENDDENEEENEDDIDFSDYEDLSPDKVWEAVRDTDHAKVSFVDFDGNYEVYLEKDRQKAKIYYNKIVNYIDFKKGVRYVENEEGSYDQLELSDNEDWEFYLRFAIDDPFSETGISFFLRDNWYEKTESEYYATPETIEYLTLLADDGTAYMESENTAYTFVCLIWQNGVEKKAMCKVEFDKFPVDLPDASSDQTPKKKLEKIELVINPLKTEYYVGEKLDVSGGVIYLYYSNGSSGMKSLTEDLVYGFDSSSPGVYILTIKYKSDGLVFTDDFEVTVLDKPSPQLIPTKISILGGIKTNYKVGERLSTESTIVAVYYSDNSIRHINLTNELVFGFTTDAPGNYTVTIRYTENGCLCETTYNIIVTE